MLNLTAYHSTQAGDAPFLGDFDACFFPASATQPIFLERRAPLAFRDARFYEDQSYKRILWLSLDGQYCELAELKIARLNS